MLTAAKSGSLPRALPLDKMVGIVSIASFLWLLASDAVHPLAIYLLGLFLSF